MPAAARTIEVIYNHIAALKMAITILARESNLEGLNFQRNYQMKLNWNFQEGGIAFQPEILYIGEATQ